MTPRGWKSLVGLAACALLMSMTGLTSAPVGADVTKLQASAFGADVTVGLLGGPPARVGPSPVANLPEGGGQDTKSEPEFMAQFGPATILGGRYVNDYVPSGELTASVEGKTGPDGFASSTARMRNIGPDILLADEISSSCRATEAGVTGSVAVAKGEVVTKFNEETQEPISKTPIANSPAPNTAIEGTLDHIGDKYRVVLNEQKTENGILTVTGAHMYLLGPNAVGDLYVAQSVCGVPGVVVSTAPPVTEPATTTTIAAPVTQPATTLDAEPASDSGGAGTAIVIAVVVLVVLGAGALIYFRRRGGPAAPA